MNENPEKSIYQYLQLLIDKLCKQQHAIDIELRTPRTLTNKLITACQGVPACRIAISNPSEDLASLINKLQSSVVAWEKENPNSTQSQTFFTDRRYHRDNNTNHRSHRSYERNRIPEHRSSNSRPKARCYVCQKEDCRSWKHTDEEQAKARDIYKSKFNDRTKGRYNNRFEERFKQYIADYEDDNSDSSEDLDDIFETLITDIGTELSLEEPSTAYITAFGDLTPEQASSMSMELANKACVYATIADSAAIATKITIATLDENPFIYSSASRTTKLRYILAIFIGIMIDTRVSKKSTASYSQF